MGPVHADIRSVQDPASATDFEPIVTESHVIQEETLAHAVRAARLNVAFEGHPLSLTLSVVLATITLGVLWPSGNTAALIVWYAVFLAVTAARLSLFLTHRKLAANATPAVLERLQTQLVTACTVAGASWGLACLIAFPDAPLLRMFLAFVIAGVSAAAVASLSSIRAAAMGFVLACALPLAARLLTSLESTDVAMSIMVLLFVVLVAASAARLDAQHLAFVRSRLEADEHLRARNAKHAELELLHDRLRLAVQAGNAGVFDMDLADNSISCDAQVYEMYGIEQVSERLGYELWRQRVHPQDLARVEAGIASLIAGSKPQNEEFRVLWADGTERVIKSTAIVQRDAAGVARRIVGMNADITELKRVDRMKSEFVSIVSHELRTPLTSIRAALGLIASGGAGPIADKAQQLLQLANRNAERLGVLVDDMLDMERIESGKLRFELAPQALQPIVEQALAVNTAYANARKVTLRLASTARDAVVAVDANRLLQVMTNLLSNAVKFSPQDAHVDIEVHANERRVTIEVRDHGPGIAPEFQPKLFSKFCQGDSSDTRVQGGSGLGLAISKALIEQMSGRIHFTTGESGTSFFIELPRRSAQSARDAERTTVALPVALA
jgi:PAS domain S-box-containing protein